MCHTKIASCFPSRVNPCWSTWAFEWKNLVEQSERVLRSHEVAECYHHRHLLHIQQHAVWALPCHPGRAALARPLLICGRFPGRKRIIYSRSYSVGILKAPIIVIINQLSCVYIYHYISLYIINHVNSIIKRSWSSNSNIVSLWFLPRRQPSSSSCSAPTPRSPGTPPGHDQNPANTKFLLYAYYMYILYTICILYVYYMSIILICILNMT